MTEVKAPLTELSTLLDETKALVVSPNLPTLQYAQLTPCIERGSDAYKQACEVA